MRLSSRSQSRCGLHRSASRPIRDRGLCLGHWHLDSASCSLHRTVGNEWVLYPILPLLDIDLFSFPPQYKKGSVSLTFEIPVVPITEIEFLHVLVKPFIRDTHMTERDHNIGPVVRLGMLEHTPVIHYLSRVLTTDLFHHIHFNTKSVIVASSGHSTQSWWTCM